MINRTTQSISNVGAAFLLIAVGSSLTACASRAQDPSANEASQCRDVNTLLKSNGISETTAGLPAPNQSFEQWKAGLRQDALSQGISADIFDKVFVSINPDSDVIAATQKQPEIVTPIWSYIEQRITQDSVSQGKALLENYKETLNRIAQRYPVDSPLLFAFLSIESNYGLNAGEKSVIRSLATLDYYNYRQSFNRQNLIAALRIIQKNDALPEQLKGSWAGAMGMPQFIPASYLQYAVDFDGDNHPNIWTSFPDSLASVANYMQKSGWKKDMPWGFEISLPTEFDYSVSGMDNQKAIKEWQLLGVRAVVPRDLKSLAAVKASLLLPVGKNGPAFLVTDNFRAILRYNNDISYALTVALLSDNYLRDTPVQKPWPRNELPLTRKQREALQILLQEKQLYRGTIDGILGQGSIAAVRAYQQQVGLPVDGYPDQALLDKLLCH